MLQSQHERSLSIRFCRAGGRGLARLPPPPPSLSAAHRDAGQLILAAAPDALLDDALNDLAVACRRTVTVESSSQEEVERIVERRGPMQRGEEMAPAPRENAFDAAIRRAPDPAAFYL